MSEIGNHDGVLGQDPAPCPTYQAFRAAQAEGLDMLNTHPTARFASKNVRVFANPFPHALINPFIPDGVFETLVASWPSAALYPVPAERELTNPRRRHLWLNEFIRMDGINAAWFKIARFFGSGEFQNGLMDLLVKCGGTPTQNFTCVSRLCEEQLPYHLERHLDRTEKVLSLICYVDGGPGQDIGTVLYGKNETKCVRSKANSALLLPNTKDSYHGGAWNGPVGILRRTIQVFVIDANAAGPTISMQSGRG